MEFEKFESAAHNLADMVRHMAEQCCEERDIYAIHMLVGEMRRLHDLPRKLKQRLGNWK